MASVPIPGRAPKRLDAGACAVARRGSKARHRPAAGSITARMAKQVKLPDGTELELDSDATGADAALAIGPRLAKAAIAVKVDGELRDLDSELPDGAEIRIVTPTSEGEDAEDALWLVRHDAAHVMATAVLDLWPETKVSIGPPIADGFYYDFEFPDGFRPSEDDLDRIEKRMRAHVEADERFERSEVSATAAVERFRSEGQRYKVELIEDLVRDEGVEAVSLYRNGPFVDLCRGPHGPSTRRIGAFKLNSVAGAYWRGDETRQMLTRIYGTAFHSQRELDRHLERLAEARARDHRRLGPELGLFTLRPEAPGMPLWLPNGTVLLRVVEAEVREQLARRGYEEIKTPQVLDTDLWHRSGHWENYRENMFFAEPSERGRDESERRYALKPMNCPGACLAYADERRSYRDLPLRLAEFGLVSRYEREGVLHGLLRVRAFTQDDAHVYCTVDQLADEVDSICEGIDELYARFGFKDVRVELSTRPQKSIGSDEEWESATGALRVALERQGREYDLSPGEGTFYGPKVDFHITDALGRSWQCGTCQIDFQMPERFELTYQGADNVDHRPVMIHRALLGSMERFVGILIEHYAGRFPTWLAPIQAAVLPVSDRHLGYAERVAGELGDAGARVRVDERSESVGKKIRDAEIAKLPYMLVVGDREAQSEAVSLREHDEGDLGPMPVAEAARRITAGE
jgi:threonyl-tRNA synthetase